MHLIKNGALRKFSKKKYTKKTSWTKVPANGKMRGQEEMCKSLGKASKRDKNVG